MRHSLFDNANTTTSIVTGGVARSVQEKQAALTSLAKGVGYAANKLRPAISKVTPDNAFGNFMRETFNSAKGHLRNSVGVLDDAPLKANVNSRGTLKQRVAQNDALRRQQKIIAPTGTNFTDRLRRFAYNKPGQALGVAGATGVAGLGGAGLAVGGLGHLNGMRSGHKRTLEALAEAYPQMPVSQRLLLAMNPDRLAGFGKTASQTRGFLDTVNQGTTNALTTVGGGVRTLGDHMQKNPNLYKMLAAALGIGYAGYRLGNRNRY